MPGTPTARRGLPVVDGDVDYVSTGDDVFNEITAKMEIEDVIFLRGAAGSRPAASIGTPYKNGVIYEATDTDPHQISWSTGPAWIALNSSSILLNEKGFSQRGDTAWPGLAIEVGRFPIAQACILHSVAHVYVSGGTTKFAWQRSTGGGAFASITGLTSVAPTTTKATITSGLALLAGDDLRLVITQAGDAKGGYAVAILSEVT